MTFRLRPGATVHVRKTRSLEAALPWLYLKGISSGEMGEALKVSSWSPGSNWFVSQHGIASEAGLGLKNTAKAGARLVWMQDRWVYVWADGMSTAA